MNPESLTLIQSGAATLVSLMVTDSWQQIRARMGNLLGKGEATEGVEPTLRELDESRDELLTARTLDDTQLVGDIEAGWRTRLRRLLATDPEAVMELRSIVEEFTPAREAQEADTFNFSGTFNGAVLGKGTQYNG